MRSHAAIFYQKGEAIYTRLISKLKFIQNNLIEIIKGKWQHMGEWKELDG